MAVSGCLWPRRPLRLCWESSCCHCASRRAASSCRVSAIGLPQLGSIVAVMDASDAPSVKSNLPLILMAALVQGLGLLALDRAGADHRDPAWRVALWVAAFFGPLTIQLLAACARNPVMWALAAGITGIFFYFGWHEGATRLSNTFDEHFAFAVALTVLWLLILPFVQARLSGGQWRNPYGALFADAWRNILVLAEAGMFTRLFWLLLELWQVLLDM